MSSKLLMQNLAKHVMFTAKAPHVYIVTQSKLASRAILVGVSVYFTSDAIFRRYFDTQLGSVVETPAQDITLSLRIPWLKTENGDGVVNVPLRYADAAFKKSQRVKMDLVFEIEDGKVPEHFLLEVFRGIPQHAFCLDDHVTIATHFVIF